MAKVKESGFEDQLVPKISRLSYLGQFTQQSDTMFPKMLMKMGVCTMAGQSKERMYVCM